MNDQPQVPQILPCGAIAMGQGEGSAFMTIGVVKPVLIGLQPQAQPYIEWVVSVDLSPLMLKRLARDVMLQLETWEAKHGEIVDPEPVEAKVVKLEVVPKAEPAPEIVGPLPDGWLNAWNKRQYEASIQSSDVSSKVSPVTASPKPPGSFWSDFWR